MTLEEAIVQRTVFEELCQLLKTPGLGVVYAVRRDGVEREYIPLCPGAPDSAVEAALVDCWDSTESYTLLLLAKRYPRLREESLLVKKDTHSWLFWHHVISKVCPRDCGSCPVEVDSGFSVAPGADGASIAVNYPSFDYDHAFTSVVSWEEAVARL